MQESDTLRLSGINREKNIVPEEPTLTRIPINAFHGQSKFYCKACAEFVFVACLVKGTMPHPDLEGETIIVDCLEDELGHTLKEMSR